MPQNITTLKIRKNGTMKVAADYAYATFASQKPGIAVQLDAATGQISEATGVTSNVLKGLLVEQTTVNENQNNISFLADEAEVAVTRDSLASGVEFTIGARVYHDSSSKLTPSSGTGNVMGTALNHIYSNGATDLILITRSAQSIANENMA